MVDVMESKFQFSMRRALVATTLVALSFSVWPVVLRTDIRTLPAHWVNPYRIATMLAMFALPAAAVGCLFRHTLACVLLGIAFAVGLFLLILVRAG